ncbi:MAG: hypothetical protein WC568_07915, partial [Candidatus Methanoperedens sp.]
MPFSSTKSCTSEQWTEIFENVHKLAITGSRLGYECQRSKIRTGAFIKDILTQLNQADVVLADLTDMNPNVLYELGVRHTLKNRTILVSQNLDEIPSDLRQYGVIKYNTTPKGIAEYKQKINKITREIRDSPDRSDNPVSDYLHLKSIVTDSFEAKSVEKKLVALISECSYNIKVTDDIRIIAPEKAETIFLNRFQVASLEILISTFYIYPDTSYIEEARSTFTAIVLLNSHIDLMKDKSLRGNSGKLLIEYMPLLNGFLINFMKKTSNILKDFRNQNFIEPSELAICISKEGHKAY